ncbi:uncharacterized protein LOC110987156 isoform X2 [Acanthaster planci]|uniref:Netrin receptor UNC5 n=1 Tax=Acanthaster planci TaxID=133434 RepID=A0A8B7ZKB1_ACAPL|nr:uncharacterized protein LOC110987156 isoform X2 [Acanthaster planci]
MSSRPQHQLLEMEGRERLATVSGGVPFHREDRYIGKSLMHERSDSGFNSAASLAIPDEPGSEELRWGSSHLYRGGMTQQKHSARGVDGTVQRRYTVGAESGSQELLRTRRYPKQVTNVRTERHTRDRLSVVPDRLSRHENNDINFGHDRMHGQGAVSGFKYSSSLADKPGRDCPRGGSSYFLRDLQDTCSGSAFISNPDLGHGADDDGHRCTVWREAETRQPLTGRAIATISSSEVCNRPSSTIWMPDRKPRLHEEESRQRSCTSTPNLLIPDSIRLETEAEVAKHGQEGSLFLTKSAWGISSYTHGGYWTGSNYITNDKALRINSMGTSLPSATSSRGAISLQDWEEHGRVHNDISQQNFSSAVPANPVRVEGSNGGTLAVQGGPSSTPLDVIFIRRILSVASHCIPSPVSMRSNRDFDMQYSAEITDDAYQPPHVEEKRNPPSPELEPCSAHIEVPSDSRDLNQYANFEKKAYLEAFDMMRKCAMNLCIDIVGRVFQISNFAGAMLDRRGGYLSIDDLDVHLYVPFGAVPDGPPQLVYIFVEGNMIKDKDQLTPCIHCGPSALRFRKDVFLTFPHCAQDATNHLFTLTKSMSGRDIWKIRDGVDGLVLVKSHSITVTMDHFCGYVACALVSAKSMLACVFINEDITAGKAAIRLRIINNTKSDLREVELSEKKHDFYLADMEEQIWVERDGGDVIATLTSESECWEITKPACGTHTFKNWFLWRPSTSDRVSAYPSKLFFASRNSSVKTPFRACMTVKGHVEVEFLVKSPTKVRVHDLASTKKLVQVMMDKLPIHRDDSITFEHFLPEDIYQDLCDVLDLEMPIPVDWRRLPENLPGLSDQGCGLIRRIESRARLERRSPCGLVLDAFFAESMTTGRGKAESLRDLRRALHELNRRDVQFAIKAIDVQLMRCGAYVVAASPSPNHDINNNAENDSSVLMGRSTGEGQGGRETTGQLGTRMSDSLQRSPVYARQLGEDTATVSKPCFTQKDSAYSSLATAYSDEQLHLSEVRPQSH